MAIVTIKRNHHWSDDWNPYLLTINGIAKGNLYDNQSLSFDLPEGTHQICLRVEGVTLFKTTIAVKDKPLSLQIDTNNKTMWQRYAIFLILMLIPLLPFDARTEIAVFAALCLFSLVHYYFHRGNSIKILNNAKLS